MKIPSNSNFIKELSKKFKRIFHQNTTFGEIQNLQDNLINPVDTYLFNQVSQLKEKTDGQTISQTAKSVRQLHFERARTVEETDCNKGKEKNNSLEITFT